MSDDRPAVAFEDFGQGTPVTLHGREAVLTHEGPVAQPDGDPGPEEDGRDA